MYVVRVADFMGMTAAAPHQALRAAGVVSEFRGSDVAVFVSHQWCGRHHADPEFHQLSVLRRVFRHADEGTLKVHADLLSMITYGLRASVRAGDLRGVLSWVMWYDFFSVPQPHKAQQEGAETGADAAAELGRAIASLATYVESSRFFVMLTPTMRHEDGHFIDFSTWTRRGWCRFERLARQLSTRECSMLLARGEDTLWEIGTKDVLMDPVGRGEFGFEADKGRLGPIVQSLLWRKLSHSLDAGRREDGWNLLAWCTVMMDGLPVDWRAAVPPAVLDLAGPRGSGSPFAPRGLRVPLLVAAGVGDSALLRSVLRGRADVACRARRDQPAFFHRAGQQPLHIAALHGHVVATSLLLEHRARVDALDGVRETPAMLAAASGKSGALRRLLEARADPNYTDLNGVGALHMAAIFDRPQVVAPLLAWRASCEANEHGTNALHNGIALRAGAEVVSLLISAGTSMDDRMRPRLGSRPWLVLSVLTAAFSLGLRHPACAHGYHAWGATPLMISVMADNSAAMWELLSARADVCARNDRGCSAVQLAKVLGMSWAVAMLERAVL